MPTQPQTIAGRYRVLREVGRGGMGAVWLCEDDRLGRQVAVKTVGRLPGESSTDQARALREARSSAALNHRNVVAVYDAIAEDDHIWLVMEYVPGRTLAEMVRDEGPLPPERVAAIGAQVADGLAAAHARGTVHRDVKPGNVLIGEDDLAKISDFGIARTQGDDQLTQSGMLTGTPAYFAPEIARGGDPSPSADVWALGATLYAAVEGRPPYPPNDNALALLGTIADRDPDPPQRAGPLAQPLARMLDRDPGSRWSMADAAAALHRVAGGEPALGGDTREDTAAFAATVPAAAAAAAPTEPAPGPGPEPTPEPEPAPPPPTGQRRRWGPLPVLGLVALLVVVIAAIALLVTNPGGEEDPASAPPSASDTEPEQSQPTDEQTEQEPSEASEPTETEEGQDTSGGSRFAFVEEYYGVLPEDTEAGWDRLSPEYQDSTSFEDYDGFWSTVESVSVEDTAPAGSDAVDVSLVYNGEEEEVRRIYLERADGGWLITGDEVVG